MDVVNPFSRGTWFNHAPPVLPEWMPEELLKIGGKVPSGELAGKPVLIFEWGQTAMAFRCGKMRLKYVDTRIPAHERTRRFIWRSTPEFERFDERGVAVYKKEIVNVEEPPAILEAGWFYHEDIPALTWIGQQLWYISQWKPADMLGSPEMWEKHRYDWWENPETGKDEYTDMVGPFPRAGRYEPIFVVAEQRNALLMKANAFLEGKQELVEKMVMCYTEPTREHIEQVRNAWKERESRPFETMLELSRDAFRRDKERREEARAAGREERKQKRAEIDESLKPKIFQREVNLANMPTRFGKGRRINVNSGG